MFDNDEDDCNNDDGDDFFFLKTKVLSHGVLRLAGPASQMETKRTHVCFPPTFSYQAQIFVYY